MWCTLGAAVLVNVVGEGAPEGQLEKRRLCGCVRRLTAYHLNKVINLLGIAPGAQGRPEAGVIGDIC